MQKKKAIKKQKNELADSYLQRYNKIKS